MKKLINNIIHRFKEDSLARRKGATDRAVEYQELKSIRKCLVFWVADEDEDSWLKNMLEVFRGVKLDKLCFLPAGGEMAESGNLVIMRNEDLGFGGKIQNERLMKILDCPYDLLVDLTTESSVLGNYVLTNNQAKCIVGMKKENGVADILIDGTSGPVDFIQKLSALLSEVNRY